MDIDYTVGEVELSYKPKFKNIYKWKIQCKLPDVYKRQGLYWFVLP